MLPSEFSDLPKAAIPYGIFRANNSNLKRTTLLLDLASSVVCHASNITTGAVSSYLAFSPLPQHPSSDGCWGGIFSVALSVIPFGIPGRYPAPCSTKFGLSSSQLHGKQLPGFYPVYSLI